MEDFDYIDALAKSELSDRTVTPSVDGWNDVQQKMKRKKRRRFIIYFFMCALLCSLGIYIGLNVTSDIGNSSVTNKNTEQLKSINSKNTTTGNTEKKLDKATINNTENVIVNANDTSRAGTNADGIQTATEKSNQHQATNNMHGDKNSIAQAKIGINSRFNDSKNDAIHTNVPKAETNINDNNQLTGGESADFIGGEENISLNAAGLKLYNWELITPEKLKKKRKKRKRSSKKDEVYENLDVMIGLNGFATSNDYKLSGSYVVELSYTDEKKLKNNYFLNYGASLQFRNLRFKNDTLSFNRGELSMNLLSSVEKRFGNFGVEAGTYLGYEFYSPNNDRFKDSNSNFLEQKINYGFFTMFSYNKIGLVFKYELSPYINYIGEKKFGAFTIGVKYDF